MRSWRRWAVVAAAVIAFPLASLVPPSSAGAESSLAAPPKGANNFHCVPSAAHPYPLVLVHGLGATMAENWAYLSPILAAHGYCVFALTYGINPKYPEFGGTIPIEQSAPELAAFVDQVLAATGASKVDLIGHSEGTFMPEYWLKFLGGAAKVNQYIALAPLYKGTNLGGAATLRDLFAAGGYSQAVLTQVAQYCGSCPEFLAGSPMVQLLNSGPGGAAVPGVSYTTIMTRDDEVVSPYTSGYLDAPNATNIVVQNVCPNDIDEHVALAVDPVVAQLVLNALDPSTAQKVSCLGLPPLAPEPKA